MHNPDEFLFEFVVTWSTNLELVLPLITAEQKQTKIYTG